MLQKFWPIGLIVLSNIFYNICSKEIPQSIHPLAALTVTYLMGTVSSMCLYLVLNRGSSLLAEYKNLNWSSFVLGIAIVGLEAGSIYMFRAGWTISTGQLVYSTILAICLIAVGYMLYHETISLNKVIGILLCLVGLYFINK